MKIEQLNDFRLSSLVNPRLVSLDYDHRDMIHCSMPFRPVHLSGILNRAELINGPNFYNSLLANGSWVIENINLRCLCSEKWRPNSSATILTPFDFTFRIQILDREFKRFFYHRHSCVCGLFAGESFCLPSNFWRALLMSSANCLRAWSSEHLPEDAKCV